MPEVVGLRCPHCAAALKVESGATSATCAYCGTTSMLRGNTIAAAPRPVAASSGRGKIGCLIAAIVVLLMLVVAFLTLGTEPAPGFDVQRAVVAAVPPRVATPRTAQPPPPPPVREVARIDTGRRPLLVDADADGALDVVALTDLVEGDRRWSTFAAHSGKDGTLLWAVDLQDGEARGTIAAVAHGRLLLLSDKGQVHGHDLRTGASQWSTALGERGQQFCACATADAIEVPTADGRVLQLDVKTGRQTPVAAIPGECAAVPTDRLGESHDPSDRRDTRAPDGVLAIRCGGVTTYTSAGMTRLPDQCRVRTRINVDALPGLVAHSLWQTDAGWLVLGVRKPGTYVPTIALVDRTSRKSIWKADVPDGNPLLADQGGPDPATIAGDLAVVGYTVKDQPPHLTAFALADGARKWHIDVPGGKRVQHAAVADARLFLYADGAVHVLDPQTGSSVRTIGKPN